MFYFENNKDFNNREISGGPDFIKYLLLSLFMSPLRLLSEISTKILYTGEKLTDYLRNCIFINLIMIVLSVSVSFLVTKKFYFAGSILPLPSLILSFIILVILYFVNSRFDFAIYLEEPNEDEISVDVFEEPLEEIVVEDTSMDDEIITEESVEEVFEEIVDEVVPIMSEEIDKKLKNLLENFKESAEDFTPASNVKSLYISENDLEGECEKMIRENQRMTSEMSREELLKELANARPFEVMEPVVNDREFEENGTLDAVLESHSEFDEIVDDMVLGESMSSARTPSTSVMPENVMQDLLSEVLSRKETISEEEIDFNFDNFSDDDFM